MCGRSVPVPLSWGHGACGVSSILDSIHITSGVNSKGEGFCTVAARSQGDRRVLLGQLTPEEVREMALAWLSAAEAAEQDAAVLRCVRRLELPDELAGAVIAELRDSRS